MHYAQPAERSDSGDTHSMSPSGSFPVLVIVVRLIVALIDVWLRVVSLVMVLIFTRTAPPYLSAKAEVVIDDPNPEAALRRTSGRGHPRRPSPNHKNVEMMSGCAHHLFISRYLIPCLVGTAFDSSGNAISRRSSPDIQSKFPCHTRGRGALP